MITPAVALVMAAIAGPYRATEMRSTHKPSAIIRFAHLPRFKLLCTHPRSTHRQYADRRSFSPLQSYKFLLEHPVYCAWYST